MKLDLLWLKGNARNLLQIGPRIDNRRKKLLSQFEKEAGIKFKDCKLLNLALCHRSYANELIPSFVENNEKLEFLGDSVLGLVACNELYCTGGKLLEGDLSRIKSFVVSEESLFRWAKKLKVNNFILIGKGEELSGGRGKKAILADAMEAVIGAYFLDSGLHAVSKFILQHLRVEIGQVLDNTHQQDFKTLLQELAQKRFHTHPIYRLVKQEGPDHNQTFWMQVSLNGKIYGPGKGKNKKKAEQVAAGFAYKELKN